MFSMPDFLSTHEEWLIWLLGDEFHGAATPQMIAERTRLSPDRIVECIRNLERIRAVSVTRSLDAGASYPFSRVSLIREGITMYNHFKAGIER